MNQQASNRPRVEKLSWIAGILGLPIAVLMAILAVWTYVYPAKDETVKPEQSTFINNSVIGATNITVLGNVGSGDVTNPPKNAMVGSIPLGEVRPLYGRTVLGTVRGAFAREEPGHGQHIDAVKPPATSPSPGLNSLLIPSAPKQPELNQRQLSDAGLRHTPEIALHYVYVPPGMGITDSDPLSNLNQTALIQETDSNESTAGKQMLTDALKAFRAGRVQNAVDLIKEAMSRFTTDQLELVLFSRYLYSELTGIHLPFVLDRDIVVLFYKVQGNRTVFSYVNRENGKSIGLSDTFVDNLEVLWVKTNENWTIDFSWKNKDQVGCGVVPLLHLGSKWLQTPCGQQGG